MRICELFLDGFGIFHDQRVSDLPPGLSVFFGENEAGKSTMLAFVRCMLFG
ncbi:AAA family ATPase, partial [bacterium]|nr:AAA family ATPase [bacterium]